MNVTLFVPGRLPVSGYGGTQRVVVWLARGLAELGHPVTLICGEGSCVPEARLVSVDAHAAAQPGFDVTPFLPPDTEILHAFRRLDTEPDIPFIWTQEGNVHPGTPMPHNTVFVSSRHAQHNNSDTFVYNGIDPDDFEFRTQKDDYDLFLGRLSSAKGYKWAIEGARRSGRKLVLAGGWRPSLFRPHRYVGSVNGRIKARWLAGAQCLWMPARWQEPFGLTLTEALVSGTPVLGTRHGSLPEVISPDVGALGTTVDELVALRGSIDQIDPQVCRARVERWFSHTVMATEYVRMYRHYLDTGRLPAGRSAASTASAA